MCAGFEVVRGTTKRDRHPQGVPVRESASSYEVSVGDDESEIRPHAPSRKALAAVLGPDRTSHQDEKSTTLSGG